MSEAESELVQSITTPLRLEYQYTAGVASTRFLRGMADGKILGQRCPQCEKVYVPPRGSCARCGVATDLEVQVPGTGTITTFCVVRIPSDSLDIDPPFVAAHILLDGADIPFFALIQECHFDEVRMGMRVEAVWVDAEDLGPTFESIRYFRPIDEPDAPFESYKEHL